MAIKVNIENELPKLMKQLDKVSGGQSREIIRDALNETGFYVLNKLKAEMRTRLDQPKPYTLNSLYLKKATTEDLNASVQWKDGGKQSSGGQYLKPEVYGGARPQKGFERELERRGLMPSGYVAIPSENVKLDQYGNVPASTFRRILTALGALTDSAARARVKGLIKRKGILGAVREVASPTQRTTTAQTFAAIQGKDGQRLPSGIYERRRGILKLLFSFVPRLNVYRAIFPFQEIADQAAQSKFASKFDEAIKKRMNIS